MQRKTIILTFDDALRNHLEFVAPILKKYTFGATFYVCEFPDAQNFGESPYLNWKQIAELSGMGFEIGNHTKSHCDCRKISRQDFLAELTYIEEKCREHAIAPLRTFAYPGGPVAENVIGILKERGYVTARSCGDTTFDPQRDDPFRVMGVPVQDNTGNKFFEAVQRATDSAYTVLVFHGVPDLPHPWVNTEPARFEACMEYLAEQNCRVIPMREIFTAGQ